MTDAIDLARTTIVRSPVDIADWPVTVTITRLTMDPQGGLALTFAEPPPERWKWPSNPAIPSDNFQYTVWAIVQVSGQRYAAGFVQMWQGRPMGQGALPALLTVNQAAIGYENWWGDKRHLWGPMADYVPHVGEAIGFFVSAGNGRLQPGVTSVRERSNVVLVSLPANDRGDFTFAGNDQPPAPPIVVVPPVVVSDVPPTTATDVRLFTLLTLLTSAVNELVDQHARLDALGGRLETVQNQLTQLALKAPPVYSTRLLGATVTLTPK